MLRKLILGSASVLALGIGGAALDFGADADDLPNAVENMPSAETSHHWINAADLSKDDIRQAQLELRHAGLYDGSLDGVIGPQTRQALVEYQKDNGLAQTATLDAHTMVTMFGNIGTGSSTPPSAGQGTGQ
jgi:peptidoglycan hydrolase-like protein with peptidoglycan-binding domain